MKDEHDAVTIDAFNAEHNDALHAAAAEQGLTPWQLVSNRVWASKGLVAGGHYQAVKPPLVTGRRYRGSKTADNVRSKWRTPELIYQWLDLHYGPFEIDLAACEKSTKCDLYFCEEENSLEQDWNQFERMFLNPPYDDIMPWAKKSGDLENDRSIVCVVVPDDNSTAWYRKLVDHARDIINVVSDGKKSGRVAFVSAATGKPGKENNKGTVIFVIGRQRRNGPHTMYVSQTQMMQELGILSDGEQ